MAPSSVYAEPFFSFGNLSRPTRRCRVTGPIRRFAAIFRENLTSHCDQWCYPDPRRASAVSDARAQVGQSEDEACQKKRQNIELRWVSRLSLVVSLLTWTLRKECRGRREVRQVPAQVREAAAAQSRKAPVRYWRIARWGARVCSSSRACFFSLREDGPRLRSGDAPCTCTRRNQAPR
jgi:hypothetical protein